MDPLLSRRVFAERCSQALRSFGWQPAASAARVCRFVARERGDREALLQVWRRDAERLGVADFLSACEAPPNLAETAPSLYGRYLDLNCWERLSLWTVARSEGANLLLCATPEGCSLLDSQEEVALARWSAADSSEEGLSVFLRSLEERDPPRRPRPESKRLSEDLARWSDLFAGAFGPALGWARAGADRLARQLLLGLKALLATRDEALRRNLERLGVKTTDEEVLSVNYAPPEVPALADLLLGEGAAAVPHAAGAFSELERGALLRQARGLPPAKQSLIEGVVRLAAAKLKAPLQLRMLLPVDQEPQSWRLALTDPLRVHEEIEATDFYVFEPLRLKLGECGFGRVLEAVTKLAVYALQESRIVQRAGGRQLDLIEAEPRGLDERQRLVDPFNWVLGHALRLDVAPPYREAVAYLVASHVLDLSGQEPFLALPICPLVSLPALFESAPG